MIIGIDAKALTIKYPCGLKTYAYELVHHLAKMDKRNIYYMFTPQPVKIPHAHNFRNIFPSQNLRFLPWQVLMPILLWQHPTTIFHFLNYHGSLFLSHPKIITTIHDWARSSDYPTVFQNPKFGFMKYYVQFIRFFTCWKSYFFICDSYFTRKEFLKNFRTKRQCAVIHLATKKPHSNKTLSFFQRKNVLMFADFSPRKNVSRGIEAYAHLPRSIKEKHSLIIVSSITDPLDKLKRQITQLNITQNVEIKINCSESQLYQLYNHSVVLLYPSLHEGFGLPILEAMSHRCPVITANGSATKEVAGKAAILINPISLPTIQRALFDILTQPTLRQKLQKDGWKRSLQFSWEKTARLTLLLYEKCARS